MKISVANKFLAALSLGTLFANTFATAVCASPAIHYGKKGTYTINDDGSYRGCLYSGGCVVLSRKYLMKRQGSEDESTRWKKGEYIYSMSEGYIYVYQNGRLIFEDVASMR
jgi:hypothetical protein